MEGIGTWNPTPVGYLNSTTPFFYPRPEITGNILTLNEVYVSPQGSDDVTNVGVVTSPFLTITNALYYINNILGPVSSPICIFVAPGTYEGGWTLNDYMYLIGPSNSPAPVEITGNVFVSSASSDATIGIQNVTLNGLTVAGLLYDTNLEISNCKIISQTIFSALSIAQDSFVINANVFARDCLIAATDVTNVAVISANTSELTSLVLENCQVLTEGLEGSLIDMTGSLTVRNSTLTNNAPGQTLAPLIILQSGTNLTPVVSIEGTVLKYADVTTDTGGDKLAIRFNAGLQPITATMTNCTISIQLGGGATDIIKNIGAATVTLSQSANSCLLDGRDIDTTNITLPTVAFLQDSPSSVYQATYYKSANQNLVNGSTDITFDLSGAWNNDNGYITHTGGTTDFTVVQAGLYQLEWNTTVSANGATWVASPSNKFISIDVTRSPTAEQAIIGQSAFMASGTNYAQNVCSTFNLEAGDVINCRVVIDFIGGPPRALALANTIDLNTWFSWRYVSTGGGNAGVTSLAGVTGAVTLSSPGGVIGITTNGQDIEITNTGIVSLAGEVGVVTLSCPDSSITITPAGGDIALTAVAPVPSVGGKTGAVTFAAGGGIDISGGATNADPITISNTGVLSVSAGTGMSASTTTGVATVTAISRQYTLLGATVGGVITYSKASGALNQWTVSTWTLMNTIQINVPTGWVAGQSVGFDGYEYINWDSNVSSYYTIYYVTPSQATEQSLIGDRTAGITDAIFGNNSGQAYLPLNLTVPPTYLAPGGTITLRIYGYVITASHYLVSDPLIDARVNIVYP